MTLSEEEEGAMRKISRDFFEKKIFAKFKGYNIDKDGEMIRYDGE
jgi:hypothetical protein